MVGGSQVNQKNPRNQKQWQTLVMFFLAGINNNCLYKGLRMIFA